MKSIISKKIAGALVLAAAGLPLATQAADTATVQINATVQAIFSVEPIDSVTLNETKKNHDVLIKTHTNATKAKVTITSANGEDDHFSLTKGDDLYQVKATIANDDKAKFDKTNHQMMTTVKGTGDQETTLHLENNNGDKELPAGSYSGTLTVHVGAV
ncbi:hypothetical protein NG99_12765 [Erwinia typographi]|uniref:Fimbrial protein n=1 Tax=Erwinia typographi TaxID=371042 RepID=A0A0A3Z4X8_9GAMM|nr:hypothetical protein [Erwinia typographi]KGT92814.1 hypothetical protein NG99_12765 [Erwinia typographi]